LAQELSQIEQDRRLARRVAGGDEEAFDAFFREYFPRLYRFTLTRTGNDAAVAEEIVQRTMCIVVRKMGSYRGEARLFTWLCQICRNEMAALHRQEGVEFKSDLPIEDHPAVLAALESLGGDVSHPESARRSDEIAVFVRSTLEQLPQNYAVALEMKYIGGYSVAEIAERLGIGEKAAESVLSRARAAFKEGFRSLWDFEPDFVVD
jgi:RNA polymerase sigma-70 factor (ECF subfamily)